MSLRMVLSASPAEAHANTNPAGTSVSTSASYSALTGPVLAQIPYGCQPTFMVRHSPSHTIDITLAELAIETDVADPLPAG
ncbi:hypothetical protein ABZ297_28225 [Nonomuraea sp. NPDC005983]|uniref:hypothetical protein n=1 Tax=Nonomuraea sp. NPDC005983 TaxID=3155595 RepID=UPI0033B84D00